MGTLAPDLVSSALDLGFSYNPEIEGFSKCGGVGPNRKDNFPVVLPRDPDS